MDKQKLITLEIFYALVNLKPGNWTVKVKNITLVENLNMKVNGKLELYMEKELTILIMKRMMYPIVVHLKMDQI